MAKVEYEVQDDIKLVEIEEFPGIKIPEEMLQKINNQIASVLAIKSGQKWRKNLRDAVGEYLPEDIDYEKVTPHQISTMLKQAIHQKDEQVTKVGEEVGQKIKKTAAEWAAKEQQLQAEFAAKELKYKKDNVIAKIRSLLPPAQKDIESHLESIIERTVKIEFDGDTVDFGLNGSEEPLFIGGKPANINHVANLIKEQYPSIFTQPKNGFGAHVGGSANQKVVDWSKATDEDFIGKMGNYDMAGIRIER